MSYFHEKETMSPGSHLSIKVEKKIHAEQTKYQDLEIYQTSNHGKMLVLDGMIQLTEHDEFSYQEMMVHVAMFSGKTKPKNVLIIGGGDGGVAREVLKHSSEHSRINVTQVEIDSRVVELSKQHIPSLSNGAFDHPDFTLHVKDGFQYLKDHQDTFDVIITDSSDPVGPAESLFQESYYELLKNALTDNGIICCQGESLWLHLKLIKPVLQFCKGLFTQVAYGFTTIPTYPSGQIGFILCSKGELEQVNFRNPFRQPDANLQQQLRYYNAEVHQSCFVLPQFAKIELGEFLD